MRFSGQKLNHLSLAGANLDFCSFENCDMSCAMLSGAKMRNSSFSKCYMEGSSFEEICADATGFFDCLMSKSVFARANFRNCKIAGCNADYSDLHAVERSGGSLSECSFAFCRNTDAKLYEAENFFSADVFALDQSQNSGKCKMCNESLSGYSRALFGIVRLSRIYGCQEILCYTLIHSLCRRCLLS